MFNDIGRPEIALATAVLVSAAGGAAADIERPLPILLRAGSEIVDAPIASRDGESLGRITELVLDTSGSRIAYAVVDSSWELFESAHLRALPWSEIAMAPSREEFVADVSSKHFALAPGFMPGEWPSAADRHWTIDVPAHFAREDSLAPGVSDSALAHLTEALRESEPGGHVEWSRRYTEILGTNVENRLEETVAEIEDVVFDVATGRAVHVVLSYGGLLEVAEHEALVPAEIVELEMVDHRAFAPVRLETLQALEVPADGATDEELVTYASRLYRRFDVEPYWEASGYSGGLRAPSAD
jgi:sporulation protein YlmC with PRC-barrel domain